MVYGDAMTVLHLESLLPYDSRLSERETRIGRWSLSVLAEAFGTPLYVYDSATLRDKAKEIKDAFAPLGARISFAAKACSTIGVLRRFEHCGLDVDVASEGEMVAALRAGFSPKRIHFHGNCKSDHELQFAVRTQIRAIVVDGCDELERLAVVAQGMQRSVAVMVRIALPLEAETHPSLQTSGLGSKFGIPVNSEEEHRAIRSLLVHPALTFVGLHTHLGSQITDPRIYARATRYMGEPVARFARAGLACQEVSLGGGWATAYTAEDKSLSASAVATAIAEAGRELNNVRLAVEPGRALVARAAVAMYRVGSVKHAPSGRIIAVDGGMGDNPRPALYNARYTAFVPDRPLAPSIGPAAVVGRYCEAGDVLVREAELPQVAVGDFIAIPMSGAYQLSMASSYNLVPQPAAVLVDSHDARLVTKRATVADMLEREIGFSEWRLS